MFFHNIRTSVKGLIFLGPNFLGDAIMSYTFKDYLSDVASNRWLAPLAAVVIPCLIVQDKLAKQYQVLKRPETETERNLKADFGDIAAEGYRYWGGGIELRFTEACVYSVYGDGKVSAEPDYHRIDTHHNREQAARDLLGNLAQAATPYGRSMVVKGQSYPFGIAEHGEERFIVVKKKNDARATFYRATRVESLADVPAGAIPATHNYYESAIGHGGVTSTRHYAITPVDPATAERLFGLGL